MNIVLREMRANLKALIIWSGVVISFVFMGMAEFAAYYNNPDMVAVLDSFPEQLLEMFSLNAVNLTTVSGYYSVIVDYNLLMLAIHAVLLGSGIISKEERDKTVEFSCTLPISRNRLMIGKSIAAVINCISVLAVLAVASIGFAMKYTPGNEFYEFLLLSLLSTFIIQMIFLAIGILVASIIKRYKRSGAISVALLLITYFISIAISINDKLDFMKYVTPFSYFDFVKILNESIIETKFVIISIVIIIISFGGALIAYSKRDLHI